MKLKQVSKVVLSKWQSEGRGARVRRSIGRPELQNLDPFLLLDEFEGSAAEGAGFPDHPHRGFETVSYLLEGEFTHEDFAGYFSAKCKFPISNILRKETSCCCLVV